MLVKDGKVMTLNIEGPGKFEVKEHLLEQVKCFRVSFLGIPTRFGGSA